MKKNLFYSLMIAAVSVLAADDDTNSGVVESKLECLQDFDAFAEQIMNMMNVPGAAVSLVVDGEVVLKKGYGMRNVEKVLPVTTDTLFPFGSVTKSMTAFLLGQLVDEGLIDWDDPVSDHIPYFKLKDPITTYNITIRDFLTHVTGYARHDGLWYNETYERSDVIRRLRYLEPISRLRENFLYHQVGYTVAGHVAECVKDKPYEDLLKEYIFKPLGMDNTLMCINEMTKKNDYSQGYRQKNKEVYSVDYLDPYSIAPAGGMISDIEDITKWLLCVRKFGGGLVEEDTFREMITPHVVASLATKPEYELHDIIQMEAYGLGWMIVSYRGHLLVFHGGNIEGFSSVVLLMPHHDIALSVVCNKHMCPLPFFFGIFMIEQLLDLDPLDWLSRYKKLSDFSKDKFKKAQEERAVQKHENTEPSHPLHDFQGKYFHPAYGDVDVALGSNNRLCFTFNGIIAPLSHWHYDVFAVGSDCSHDVLKGLKLTFNENIHGDMSTVSMLLEPHDAEIVFKKVKSTASSGQSVLEQYVGDYSYHGFIFTMVIEDGALVVKAMGQPPFVLIPDKKHHFTVKGFDSFLVQFLPGDAGDIQAVQLVQPGGNTFTASRQ